MKNKKLFAILTLVCFMFTLMPVAAFAAAPITYDVVDVAINDHGINFAVKASEARDWEKGSIVAKLYSNEIELTKMTLQKDYVDGDADEARNASPMMSGVIKYNGSGSGSWAQTAWVASADVVPTHIDMYVDGKFIGKEVVAYIDLNTGVPVAPTTGTWGTTVDAAAVVADMYVAAQKSYVYAETTEVEVDDELDVTISLETVAPVYVWFEEKVNVPAPVVESVEDATLDGSIITVAPGVNEFKVVFNEQGTYDIHASLLKPVITGTEKTWAEAVAAVADYELRTQSGYNTVVVTAEADDTDDYVIVINGTVVEDDDTYTLPMTGIEANGIDEKTVAFKVYKDKTLAETVYASDIEIDATNSVDVSDLEVKRSGDVSFDITVAKVGTHKVYVEIGNFKATLKAAISDSEAEEIELYYVSKTPVNIDSVKAYGFNNSIVFKAFDANGNEVLNTPNGFDKATDDDTNYVTIVEQPAKSKLKNEDVYLAPTYSAYVADGWTIACEKAIVEEGTYTFKVALNDGTYATASVKVMEAGDPVALTAIYEADSVQLGESIKHKNVSWLDANYVATTAVVGKDVKIAVSGSAVSSVDENGLITIKNSESHVGSTIKITFIDEENNLVAAKTLVVASEEKDLALDTTAVPVDTTKTITAKLVDVNGNSVGLSTATKADASVIVLDKPAGADVTAEVKAVNTAKGLFTFAFSCDTVGVVEVQTVLQTNENNVVRYYTGVAEIKVGATGIEEVVVMSIGSNEIVVNDEVKTMVAAPIVKDARTFVPFRALAEAFGAEVAWDDATQAVTAELDGVKVVLTIGSNAYTVNGAAKTADVAPFIDGASTMVPVRFVAEAFGITVTPTYDNNGATADILFAK